VTGKIAKLEFVNPGTSFDLRPPCPPMKVKPMTRRIDTSGNRAAFFGDREIEILLSHLLNSRRLFDIARDHLRPDDFPDLRRVYAVLWVSVLDVVAQHDILVPDSSLRSMVEADIARRIQEDPDGLCEEEQKLLLGGEAWEGLEGNTILDHVFDCEPTELNDSYGMELLRRFLHEQTVVAPLKDALNPSDGGFTIEDLGPVIDDLKRRLQTIQSLADDRVGSLGQEWGKHLEQLEYFRGLQMIGLRTGIEQLDNRTLGLRGTTLLGAMPGVGKTALAAQLAIGVCQHHETNDAAVVIVSLDMDRDAIMDRIHCNLAGLDWATLKFGSPELRNNDGPPWFNPGHQMALDTAEDRLAEWEIGTRMLIHDRSTLGENISTNRLVALTRNFKEQVGASRALLIFDYLQLLPLSSQVAGGSDLEADRYRIRVIQDFVTQSKTAENPDGDAVLAITEARKPSSAKEGWGQALSELMGSARLGYAPDAVLLYRPMNAKDVRTHYTNIDDDAVAEIRLRVLEQDGRAPIVLTLAKGRDGMSRGEWGMEFHFRRSRFEDLEPCSVEDVYPYVTPPSDLT
jgi:replicative DNA helicase